MTVTALKPEGSPERLRSHRAEAIAEANARERTYASGGAGAPSDAQRAALRMQGYEYIKETTTYFASIYDTGGEIAAWLIPDHTRELSWKWMSATPNDEDATLMQLLEVVDDINHG